MIAFCIMMIVGILIVIAGYLSVMSEQWEIDTNMILFAIIGEELGVIESATVTSAAIIGMLIVCWAIYTVYTGGFSDLQEKQGLKDCKAICFYIQID